MVLRETPEVPWVVLSLIGFIHLAFKAYWKTFENKFYYDKKLIRKTIIEEKFMITNVEFRKYL